MNCAGCNKETSDLVKCDGCGKDFCHNCITCSTKDLHPNLSEKIGRSPELCDSCWDEEN